jgi:hypothetical protein
MMRPKTPHTHVFISHMVVIVYDEACLHAVFPDLAAWCFIATKEHGIKQVNNHKTRHKIAWH